MRPARISWRTCTPALLLLSPVCGCVDKVETPDTGDSGWSSDLDGDGYTPLEGDCNDDDPSIWPGADETPGDGTDQNCDASDAGPVVALDEVEGAWYGVERGRLAGKALAIVEDLDGDDLDDLIVGAPQRSSEDGGWVYLIHGPAAEETTLDRVEASWHGDEGYDSFGAAVTATGDLDGDSLGDVLIGAPQSSEWDRQSGVVYVGLQVDLVLQAVLVGEDGSFTGTALAGEFDANADGFADVLVGSPTPGDYPSPRPGQADLLLGPLSDTLLTVGDTDATLLSGQEFDYGGQSVAAGDLNGDGYDDLVVGAPMGGPEGDEEGMAYVMFGPCSGEIRLSESANSISGDYPDAEAGISLAIVDDLDGDGSAELAVGAHLDERGGERAGAAYVFYDLAAGSRTVSDADVIFLAETTHEMLGLSVAGIHAADGSPALLVGAPRDIYTTAGYPGKVYLFVPPLSDTLSVADVALLYAGSSPDEAAGVGLSAGGDLDGDGRDDVAIGAPYNGEGVEEEYGGAVYVSHSAW